MNTELRCECNDVWIVSLADTVFDYMDMALNKKCPVCGYHMWYDAYQEDMFRDLKEMNT